MQLSFVVFTSPLPGREEEFYAWYDSTHMPHMLALEGVRSVRRYDVVREPDRPVAPGPYLAVFEWEIEDAAAARAVLAQARRDDVIPLHESLDQTKTKSWFVAPAYEGRAHDGAGDSQRKG